MSVANSRTVRKCLGNSHFSRVHTAASRRSTSSWGISQVVLILKGVSSKVCSLSSCGGSHGNKDEQAKGAILAGAIGHRSFPRPVWEWIGLRGIKHLPEGDGSTVKSLLSFKEHIHHSLSFVDPILHRACLDLINCFFEEEILDLGLGKAAGAGRL